MHDVCVSFCRRCNRMVVIGLRIYRSVFFCNKLSSFYNWVYKRVGGGGGKEYCQSTEKAHLQTETRLEVVALLAYCFLYQMDPASIDI